MKGSVMRHLILKDWQLHRPQILFSIAGGAVSLVIVQLGGVTPIVLGSVFFFISLMFCASLLPMSNIVNERKKQTLPFLMSLPISALQYAISKMASTLGLRVEPIGSGVEREQFPAAGTRVPVGTNVVVRFSR